MFVWDERKRQSNLEKHGLDFADAPLVYDSPNKITIASARSQEEREMDIAMVEWKQVVLVLVYVMRGEDVRVISFRPASKAERRFYEQITGE